MREGLDWELGMSKTRSGLLVFIVMAVLAMTACSSGGSNDENVSADSSSTTADEGGDDAKSDDISDEMPSDDVTLVDDVVVVNSEQGSNFKGYSSDGTSMLIADDAPGIDDLQSGEVLLLSGITVVRASSVEKSDDGVVVTGEPVTLPEVIADADLAWTDVVYDPDQMRLFVYESSDSGSGGTESGSGSGSGSSGGQSTPDESIVDDAGEGIVDGLGMSTGGGAVKVTPAAMTAANTDSVSGTVGEFSFTLNHESQGSGHHIVLDASSSGDLTGTIKVDVSLGALASSGATKVEGRQVRNFDFQFSELGGEATITTELNANKNTTSVMSPAFLKIPFGIEFPAVVSGIPFTLSLSGTFQVQLSMALAGASLGGEAQISFGGDAGLTFQAGSLSVNGTRQQDAPDLLNTVKGLANGPVGVVVTTELPKVGFGFGFLQTGAGVYLSSGMVVAQTILPPPPACTSTQIAYVLAAGVEAKFLGKEFDLGRKAVVDKRWDYTVPQTEQCVPDLRN
jgi:hypothetical protein